MIFKTYIEAFETARSKSPTLKALIDEHNAVDHYIHKIAEKHYDNATWQEVKQAEKLQKQLYDHIKESLNNLFSELNIQGNKSFPKAYHFAGDDKDISLKKYIANKFNSFNNFIGAIRNGELVSGLAAYMFLHEILKTLILIEKDNDDF